MALGRGAVNRCTFPGDFQPVYHAPREVTTAAGAVPVKQPRGRLKRRARQLGHETESNPEQNELHDTTRVLTGPDIWRLSNLFALAAVAAVAVVAPGLLTATIGHPAGIAGYLKLAWLTTSKATIGGALGAALEN
jgi:hypothetical protein